MPEETTKTKIILAAEELMLAKGFHSVGLNELLKAVEVPKGSFYHHFESKEGFGVELLKHYINDSTEWKREGLNDDTFGKTPLTRITGFLQAACDNFIENECLCPCLILKLTAEVSGYSEKMRTVVAQGYSEWIAVFANSFSQAKDSGELPEEMDPQAEAQLLIDYWYGSTHRSIATRSALPLQQTINFFTQRYAQ